MKINGTKIDAHYVETVVIPRPNGDVVFKAQAIDYAPFEKLCTLPKPPTVMKPGKDPEPNYADPKYIEARNKWALLKTDYMFMASLKATEGLVWETVVESDPSTWNNLSKELLESGFKDNEVNRIFNAVISINGLDDDKITQATKAYLATQE